MDQPPGVIASPARGHLNKRKGHLSILSSFTPENVVSRDRFSGPVPRQPAAHSPQSRLNVVLTYGVPSHTVLLLYVKQTAPAAAEPRACVRGVVQFISMASWTLIDNSLLLHFVLLTNAAAVLVLYCRFLKKKSEHIHLDLLGIPMGS